MTTLISGNAIPSKRARGSTRARISPSEAVRRLLAAQNERWVLWLAPALIAGAATWLTLPTDPPTWLWPAVFLLGWASAWLASVFPAETKARLAVQRCAGAIAALAASFALGASAAQLRTGMVAQPPFNGSDTPVLVEGWVAANDPGESGPRLRILVRDIEGVFAPPRYVRVSVADAGVLTPGRGARCRAVLSPPSGPMAPGGYDFARRAYFERLGATGFAFGRCRPAMLAPPPAWGDRFELALAALRADLSAAIVEAAPGRGGALAAALVTGDRAPIDDATNDALRDSGLGHLVSVSGIHMGVVGGLVFAVLMWTLSLIGPLALRWPVKKLAAIGALAALGAYLVISGSSVPALRAFVMACVAFGAILLDRPAISMRGLALAALVVVLLFPESVLEPGFQMSFAATMALVALFEAMKRAPSEPALPTPGPVIGALNWSIRSIGTVLFISLVAGFATDPFAIYHFQRFSLYALPANLIVAPIMSFLVAPAAGAAAVLAPFGWSEPALQVMASALDLVVAVGGVFGGRAEAVRAVAQPPVTVFVLCVCALLWACLWQGRLRLGALALLAAAIAVYVAAPQPVLAFDGELRAVFAREDVAWTLVKRSGRSTYARDRLGAMLGINQNAVARLPPPRACDENACALSTPAGRRVFVVFVPAAMSRACAESAVVVTRLSAKETSTSTCAARLVSAEDLARYGGALGYDDAGQLGLRRALDPKIHRPWRHANNSGDQE